MDKYPFHEDKNNGYNLKNSPYITRYRKKKPKNFFNAYGTLVVLTLIWAFAMTMIAFNLSST